jgi:hypothetical protein
MFYKYDHNQLVFTDQYLTSLYERQKDYLATHICNWRRIEKLTTASILIHVTHFVELNRTRKLSKILVLDH